MQTTGVGKILTVLALSLPGVGVGAAWATEVIHIKTPAIKLYESSASGASFRSMSRQDAEASLPWPVKAGPQKGMLQVVVGGQPVWVKIFAIRTDTPVSSKVTATPLAPGARDHIGGVTRGIKEPSR